MVIGLDIDGTITRNPAFFSILSSALTKAGHTVFVITLRDDRNRAIADLRKWGIVHQKLITSTPSELMDFGDEWKAMVCQKHKIEIFLDDDADVLAHMPESTFCMLAVSHKDHDLSKVSRKTLRAGAFDDGY